MSSSRRTLVVVAVLCLAMSLLIRVAFASSSPQLVRWTVPIELSLPKPESPPVRTVRPKAPRLEPYAGYDRWCEAVEPAPCRSAKDCRPAPDGKPQACVEPWWAAKRNRKLPKAERERVCASAWPRRAEQRWRRARLEAVVEHVCRGAGCNARTLGAFMGAVAQRESTWRPWKTHRLNGDLRANRSTYALKAKRYGHGHVLERRKGAARDIIAGVSLQRGGNPHYRDSQRWQGYGLFGQNSALFVYLWDPKAPPEILCREVEATDTYLERARIAARKQHSLGVRPTWATVHAAIATGDVVPKPSAVERFRPQARRAGIDPDEPVSARDFGEPLGADVPSRRLAAEILRTRIDGRFGAGS
jgi:hypothetical protein